MARREGVQVEGDERVETEETPLLGDQPRTNEAASIVQAQTGETAPSGAARENTDDDDNETEKPLPKAQILLLCLARVVEPIAFFSIFPFVNQMVARNGGLRSTEVGFYSGLIESLFSLTQTCVMILWGRASDRFGRKPVLVLSLFGVAASMGAFGLASTLWQMIALRCVAGVFAGTTVTIRTMMAELSTRRTQARVFSWFAFTGNVGIFLGPLIGGALAEPAKQYPRVFGQVQLFRTFPFFLPTLVIGVIGVISGTVTLLFVKETLVKVTPGDSEDRGAKPTPMTILQLVKAPGVATVIGLYAYIMFIAYAYTAVAPVYYYTKIEDGGYGCSELEISLLMGLTGLSQCFWLLVIFLPLQRRVGSNGVVRLCGLVEPFFFAVYPLLNLLLRQDTDAARLWFWILAPINIVIGTGVSMAFTASQLNVNNVSPSPQVLGTLNALALTLASGIRAFTPAVFTSIFAVGADNHILGGQLIWFVMVPLGVIYTFTSRLLPKNADDKPTEETDRSEEEER